MRDPCWEALEVVLHRSVRLGRKVAVRRVELVGHVERTRCRAFL